MGTHEANIIQGRADRASAGPNSARSAEQYHEPM